MVIVKKLVWPNELVWFICVEMALKRKIEKLFQTEMAFANMCILFNCLRAHNRKLLILVPKRIATVESGWNKSANAQEPHRTNRERRFYCFTRLNTSKESSFIVFDRIQGTEHSADSSKRSEESRIQNLFDAWSCLGYLNIWLINC